MASIGRKNNKFNISSKDLKKAIVDANKRLKKNNDNLSSRIKDSEKLIKSKDKDLKDLDKQLKSILKDIDKANKNLTSIKANIYSSDKEFANIQNVVKELKKDETLKLKNIDKLESKKDTISKSVAELEIRKKAAEELMDDIDSLNFRKLTSQDELNDVIKSKLDTESLIDSLKVSYDSLKDNYSKEKSALSVQLESFKSKVSAMEDMAKSAKEDKEKILSELDDDINHKNAELKAVDSLIDKAEDEYIAWEQKIKKAKQLVEKENKNVNNVKKSYESWKVNTLEQVAKMKLKNKIDNIDKAGLSEILNNG